MSKIISARLPVDPNLVHGVHVSAFFGNVPFPKPDNNQFMMFNNDIILGLMSREIITKDAITDWAASNCLGEVRIVLTYEPFTIEASEVIGNNRLAHYSRTLYWVFLEFELDRDALMYKLFMEGS